jgi:hypothetical protein
MAATAAAMAAAAETRQMRAAFPISVSSVFVRIVNNILTLDFRFVNEFAGIYENFLLPGGSPRSGTG